MRWVSASLLAGKIALLAALYWAGGELARGMALPPGYSSSIWPAAGIALAFLLRFGKRHWPGILLGSMLVNVDIGAPWYVGACIGIGASLQALLGHKLANGERHEHMCAFKANTLQSEILRVALLGGLVSCCVSSIWGTSTLCMARLVPWADWPVQMLTWWVGDALGVVLFAPISLILTDALRKKAPVV